MATTASFVAGRSLYLLERSSDLFDDVDANEDGFVTPEELAEYLKITSPETGKNFSIIASQYVAAVDSGDQDGKLNREGTDS
ncbi:hypothetical protein ABFA07_011219 [Porites harrisoni]